jgi:DNA-directed RNA polymerase subunit RPC12/RpoP
MAAQTEILPFIFAPSCSHCGTQMLLVRNFPDRPGYDRRTHECPHCRHKITEVIQLPKKAGQSDNLADL